MNVGKCGCWVKWGKWDMWELVGICSILNWRFADFCFGHINNGFAVWNLQLNLERQKDWKTIWRYACCRCGHRRSSQWFGSDPKLRCVRELSMGRVTFTLNITKAKTHPKRRDVAICSFHLPTFPLPCLLLQHFLILYCTCPRVLWYLLTKHISYIHLLATAG